METSSKRELKEIALLFLKLGCIGFGGPAVHIAMMEEETVKKRKWLTAAEFLDLLGAANLIPGPNSTELTMLIGHRRAGWKGLVLAGTCFILPAVLITGLLAWFYSRYGSLPTVRPFIYGIQPAVISVVVALMISMIPRAVKTVPLALTGLIVVAFALAGISQIALLFGAGLAAVIFLSATRNKKDKALSIHPLSFAVITGGITASKTFWSFLKIGAILYGSGYVLFSFLDDEFVKTGLLSRQVLTDAIAAGQFTPGPVFSSATFVGWQLAGAGGAIAATIGIFLPSFLLAALTKPFIPRLRSSPAMSAFLDAVNVASIALILVVCINMARSGISDWRTIAIAGTGLIISFLFRRLNSAVIIIGGAVAGYLLSFL